MNNAALKIHQTLTTLAHSLPTEMAHNLAITALKYNLLPTIPAREYPSLGTHFFDFTLPHPIGLAAGFDKNACAITGLLNQGLSFVEAGTVTPKPQPGNKKPRMFRLREDQAIINRLGFNNDGVDAFLRNRKRHARITGLVGINIGKNKDTENAIDDYLMLLENVWEFADYITINISSPNTPGLRDLQQPKQLESLLTSLVAKRDTLHEQSPRFLPLALKIAPDMDIQAATTIANIAKNCGVEGLIISNTTLARPESLRDVHASESGGLSGAPLLGSSTALLKAIYREIKGNGMTLIGVGGIMGGADAYAKIRAGANALQLYTGIIYQGFPIITQIKDELAALLERDGIATLHDAIGIDA